MPDNYNEDDLTLIKSKLQIEIADIDEDTDLLAGLNECYLDFIAWLESKGVVEIPPFTTDPDIKLLKEIESRGGAGFYYENKWAQLLQDGNREEDVKKPTNTHLALYYKRRDVFYQKRYGDHDADDVGYLKGSTADECPPDQEVCE